MLNQFTMNMNEHNFNVITLVIITCLMFQNEELSNILRKLSGDEEEADAREQEEMLCVMID